MRYLWITFIGYARDKKIRKPRSKQSKAHKQDNENRLRSPTKEVAQI